MDAKHENFSVYHATIDAPPGHVLATLQDLAAYPEWQQDITAVDILETDSRGLPGQARLTFNSMGMQMVLTLAVTLDEGAMRWSLVEGAFLTRNDAEFTVSALDGGRSELTLRQDLVLKWRMPRSLSQYMIERTVRSTLEATRLRAEATVPVPGEPGS